MSTLTYTQHTVAFPKNSMRDSVTESINVSLDHNGGGTAGEFTWEFIRWDRHERAAVKLGVFGDGLPCFLDPRIQQVVQQWSVMSDPDEMTPEQLVDLLEAAGVVPSKYMVEAVRVTAQPSRLANLLHEANLDYSIHAPEGMDRYEHIAGYLADSGVGFTKDNLDGTCHQKHEPINIDSRTRARLRSYLFNRGPRGQGYSAFIEEALDRVNADVMPEDTRR